MHHKRQLQEHATIYKDVHCILYLHVAALNQKAGHQYLLLQLKQGKLFIVVQYPTQNIDCITPAGGQNSSPLLFSTGQENQEWNGYAFMHFILP